MADQVQVKSYIRNGRVVRASVRRGRPGRGTAADPKRGTVPDLFSRIEGYLKTDRAVAVPADKGLELANHLAQNGWKAERKGSALIKMTAPDGRTFSLSLRDTKSGGLPKPPDGTFRDGVWYNKDGSVYGHADSVDAPITRKRPVATPDPQGLRPAPKAPRRRRTGRVGSGISGARP